MFRSAIAMFFPQGMTAYTPMAGMNMRMGAAQNTHLSPAGGVSASFSITLSASAMG